MKETYFAHSNVGFINLGEHDNFDSADEVADKLICDGKASVYWIDTKANWETQLNNPVLAEDIDK